MFLLPVFLLLWLRTVLANTEIINFPVTEEYAVTLPFTDNWIHLTPDAPSVQLNVTSAPPGTKLPKSICNNVAKWDAVKAPQLCPHELYLVLDLDNEKWKRFDKFTLRVSWLASDPTDFTLQSLDPYFFARFAPSKTHHQHKIRRKYARIQFMHTGVLTPWGTPVDDAVRYQLPIHILVEPLHFGVLPESVIPIVGTIVGLVVVGLFYARKVDKYLRPIADKAEEEEELKEE